MKSDLSSVELRLIQHALGLDSGTGTVIYRNRYLVNPADTIRFQLLNNLVERGHFSFVRAIEDSDLLLYEVTPTTIALVEDLRE